MERWCYVLVYQTKGFQDLSVFSSLKRAREEFDKIVKQYNLKEGKYSYYLSQAYGKLDKVGEDSNKTSLTLMKKLVNFNSIK